MAANENTETPESQTPADTPETPTEDALGDAGKKALDAERKNARAAAKERDALAAKLKELEDRDKSEAQRLADRADAAEKRAQELEARALRLEVASEKGLTPGQAKRLVGATREDLEADADELLAEFKPKPGNPRPDRTQGGTSGDGGSRKGEQGLLEAQKRFGIPAGQKQ